MNDTGLSGPAIFFGVVAVAVLVTATPDLAAAQSSETAFRLTAAPLGHFRRMELRAIDKPITHRPTPMGGFSVSAESLLLWDPELKTRVDLHVSGRHARGRTSNFGTSDSGDTFTTQFTSIVARLALTRPLTEAIRGGFVGGARTESWVLPPNRRYTGHRYLGGEFGVRLRYRLPSTPAWFVFDLSAVPVLDVDLSGGAHGDGTAFGGVIDLHGYWQPWSSDSSASDSSASDARFLVHGGLNYTRYRARFPTSRFDPGGATTVDQAASLSIGVGYKM